MRHEHLIGQVDWSSVGGVNGPAIEVPGLLRHLQDATFEVRAAAFDELVDLLLGEGTIWESTVRATPYLVALAGDPGSPGRRMAFTLLSAIACGGDEEAWMARRPSIARFRKNVTDLEAMDLDGYRAWLQEFADNAPSEREREWRQRDVERATVEMLQANREMLRPALDAYDAARAGIPAYVAALEDDEPFIRMFGLKMLSWFGDEDPEHAVAVGGIQKALDTETSVELLSAACMCAGVAGRPGDTKLIDRIRELQDHPAPPVWGAAAMAWVWLGQPVRREIVKAVYDCLFEAPNDLPWFPFLDGDMTAMAAVTVAMLPAAAAEDRVAMLVLRWATTDPGNDELITRLVLDAAFPDGPLADGVTFASLDSAARSAVEAFRSQSHRGLFDTWAILSRYNLPTSIEELDEWIDTTR
jgi:hypothetical protein